MAVNLAKAHKSVILQDMNAAAVDRVRSKVSLPTRALTRSVRNIRTNRHVDLPLFGRHEVGESVPMVYDSVCCNFVVAT